MGLRQNLAESDARMCHMRFTSAVRAVMTSTVLIIPQTNREKKGKKSEKVAEDLKSHFKIGLSQ